MCTNNENNRAKAFWTPPPTWNSRGSDSMATTMSERKRTSPQDKNDIFHIIHKVPAGDSPYVRAKHVQLIVKDPSKAISLFWAAINAGDRVDSALKDMAVVMKQLNRSDDAIEAIKSFRHLCPYDSQDSLDNLLIELYKKSGRTEEEADLLKLKLKSLEEGTAFGGKSTKTKRCQGKQIAITVEQEKARVLGNLGWINLQQHNYGIAEQHYRKALFLEPDKNKQCNLAICLMHTDRIAEAKSLLQDVRDSLGNQWQDGPYSKSFKRAVQVLTEIESRHEHDNIGLNSSKDSFSQSDKEDDPVHFPLVSELGSDFSAVKKSSVNWDGGSYSENSYEKSCFARRMKENRAPVIATEPGSAYKKTYFSPASVRRNSGSLLTQPRRCKLGDQRKGRCGENMVGSSVRRLSFEKTLAGDESVHGHSTQDFFGQKPVASRNGHPEKEKKLDQKLIHCLHEFITGNTKPGQDSLMCKAKKSWADMVDDEEEQEGRRKS